MTIDQKVRVAVLYGGCSTEHEISLQSARSVIEMLDRSRFEIILIGIDREGNWRLGEEVFFKSIENKAMIPLSSSDEVWFNSKWIESKNNFLNYALKKTTEATIKKPLFDVIFPVVHGNFCEDGALQGLLTLSDTPYVGCGVLSSAIGMDKDVSKRLVSCANIPILPYVVLREGHWKIGFESFVQQIEKEWGYPVFVKPANTGSSIGIRKVKIKDQLLSAIEYAFQFDKKVLIEQSKDIIELEVAVLESLDHYTEPMVSVVGEIKPNHDEFYSYYAKYIDTDGATLYIPTRCNQDVQERARTLAKEVFLVLECEGMARVDLFFDKITQQLYFNEINTIPGFTKISMYPKLLAASGMSYQSLLTHLINLAIKKYKNTRKLMDRIKLPFQSLNR